MTMQVSEKSFLEKIAAHVPGIAGYREREGRRETDRRLREFLAGRVGEARAALDGVRNRVTASGALSLMNDVARLDRALQKAESSLRFADYGYSGVFDQLKIREAELERIYAYDLALVADVQAVGDKVRGLTPDAASLADASRLAEDLDAKIVRRKEIFEAPAV